MLFNSWEFALFFPIVVVVFFAIPPAFRWLWLLISSCIFYGAYIPEYLAILLLTISVDYLAGIMIERSVGIRRQMILWVSVVVTCLILFFFKYYNFALNNWIAVCGLAGFEPWLSAANRSSYPLPIGLSFHTFQSLSYVIEVYRGRQKAERNFGVYSVYVLFFPQLVAGPIERPQNLLHQFRETRSFDPVAAASGLRLLAWGLFQKTVVADRLGVIVDYVYDSPDRANGLAAWIATVFFAFQIYADFQGYSNMARGAARVLGFELMKNFDRPYSSCSVTEFWRRWHISLSTWFRDYVYFPLGGNRFGAPLQAFSLLMTFAISGLWHGANWTYVIWGLLNGMWVMLERWMGVNGRRTFTGLQKTFRQVVTFLLILVTWVFFRSRSVESAMGIFGSLGTAPHWAWPQRQDFFERLGTTPANFGLCLVAIVALQFLDRFELDSDMGHSVGIMPVRVRWPAYAALVSSIILSWIFFPASAKPFIYFQF